MTLPPVHEGTLHARPVEHSPRHGELHGGSVHGKLGDGGTLHGDHGLHGGGGLHGATEESPNLSAQAEVNNLISSLGSLASQAGSMPLTPPTLPGLPQTQGYQPQPTDYTYDQPN
jgi:hypothetical protein